MLTIFTAPKPFRGHISLIQRNAIRSWTLLRPACDVILFGDEPGIAEIAAELGVRHVPHVATTKFGTPLINDLFEQAQRLSKLDLFCCLNSDIVLMSDFMEAIGRVVRERHRFLLVGHRWNLDVSAPIDFTAGWEDRLLAQVRVNGKMGGPASIDFFVFTRDALGRIPPFVIGRPRWDNWMLYRARSLRMPLIDATAVVTAVHQNHDYAHHPGGFQGMRSGDEAMTNEKLAESDVLFMLTDATYRLTPRRLERTLDRAHLLRHCATLPELYRWKPLQWAKRAMAKSHPMRSRLGLTFSAVSGRFTR